MGIIGHLERETKLNKKTAMDNLRSFFEDENLRKEKELEAKGKEELFTPVEKE
jgi:hypothetical protein